MVYFGSLLLVETLAMFLYLWLLAALVRNPRSSRGWTAWLFAGMLLGIGATCRPSVLVFLPIPMLGLWLDPRGDARRRRLGTLGAYLLGATIPILPVTLHNVVAGKDLVLIAWSDGINLYIGNNPEADGASAIAPGMRADWWGGYHDAYRLAEKAAGRPLAPNEVSGHWRTKAFQFIVGHPKRAAALLARKAAYLVSAIERSNNYPIYYFRSQSPFLRWPWVGYGLVFPLAVYGGWARASSPLRLSADLRDRDRDLLRERALSLAARPDPDRFRGGRDPTRVVGAAKAQSARSGHRGFAPRARSRRQPGSWSRVRPGSARGAGAPDRRPSLPEQR
jgi:hypothetical protein